MSPVVFVVSIYILHLNDKAVMLCGDEAQSCQCCKTSINDNNDDDDDDDHDNHHQIFRSDSGVSCVNYMAVRLYSSGASLCVNDQWRRIDEPPLQH